MQLLDCCWYNYSQITLKHVELPMLSILGLFIDQMWAVVPSAPPVSAIEQQPYKHDPDPPQPVSANPNTATTTATTTTTTYVYTTETVAILSLISTCCHFIILYIAYQRKIMLCRRRLSWCHLLFHLLCLLCAYPWTSQWQL